MNYDIYILHEQAKDETEAKAAIRRFKKQGIKAVCMLSEEGITEFRKKHGFKEE